MPEGNYTAYTYDSRANVTQVTEVAKAGSGLANIVTSAVYPASCANTLTCNQPSATIDARGHQTDYTYDPNHGGVLTVMAPAPTVGAVRPQTRLTYTSRYAWYKNSSGSVVQAPTPIALVTQSSACATLTSCSNGADETRTTTAYGTAGVANNLAPTSVTVSAGNGSVSSTIATTYDAVGNVLTLDGPLAGSADLSRLRYDAVRQLVGAIGPDPDGAGPLKHRATRTTYNLDGQPVSVERGTVNSQSDGDWAAFASLQQSTTSYDTVGRPVVAALVAGGTTYSLVQTGYDAASRPLCVATRMNPAAFGSLPSACTLGAQGADGPDRIVKMLYTNADQVSQVLAAFGTSLQQSERTITYTANGLQATLSDALGNLTTFEYDGFDRTRRIRFPNAANGSTSSNSDYFQYS